MKKYICLSAIALLFASTQLSAQLVLLHYWNFNTISISTADATSKDRNATGNALTPIAADFTLITPATVAYRVKPTIAAGSVVNSYWDAAGVQTGTSNQRGTDISGNGLRPRDAWQNMELVLNIPSTGYKNITIKYDSQRSGSGPTVNTYFYSVDGGLNWITTGLSTLTNPVAIPSTGFALQTVGISDVNANNNANLQFKIWYSDPTNTGGNNRIDNITVEASDITASISDNQGNNELTMTLNTAINGVVNFNQVVDVVVYNLQGKQLKSVLRTNQLSTADLAKGIYIVRLNGLVSKKLVVG